MYNYICEYMYIYIYISIYVVVGRLQLDPLGCSARKVVDALRRRGVRMPLGIQPFVKSHRSSYTGLYPQRIESPECPVLCRIGVPTVHQMSTCLTASTFDALRRRGVRMLRPAP